MQYIPSGDPARSSLGGLNSTREERISGDYSAFLAAITRDEHCCILYMAFNVTVFMSQRNNS